MPWYMRNSSMLDAMSELAADPEKLDAFKADPEAYLSEHTDLDEDSRSAILSQDHETMLRALMSKVSDDDSAS